MKFRIAAFELLEVDLPFRSRFRHAAADRSMSGSLFLRCTSDDGHIGHGESLPRPYVTGEERSETFKLLTNRILPRLLEMEFGSLEEVIDFLIRCDGKAPAGWVDPDVPQTAAWCLVDLALLDTCARAMGKDLMRELTRDSPPDPSGRVGAWPEHLEYSLVLSDDTPRRMLRTLVKARLYGLKQVKVKVDGPSLEGVRLARRILGRNAHIRTDANMAWSYDVARAQIEHLFACGVESIEQPLPAADIDGLAQLTAGTRMAVMADESCHDAASLHRLIRSRACSAVNIRISKCGGLIASIERCREAMNAGLTVQVGCQVGETSHLSAAQMVLVRAVGSGIRYLEGCFGERLLETDPVSPRLQFGRGGHPPPMPTGPGFGTEVDLEMLRRYSGRRTTLHAKGHVVSEEIS